VSAILPIDVADLSRTVETISPERRFSAMQSRVAAVIDAIHQDDETGQGLAEYALILALIAVIAIVALIFLGSQISDKLSVVGNTL